MSKNSKIEWCDHTFNPWIGCTKVSPGCANCYAEAHDRRFHGGQHWGPGAARRRTSAANWKKVETWNRWAAKIEAFIQASQPWDADYHRPRVFVASLADWLDPEVPFEWLADLLDLIRRCPHLDFLLLTKRPELWGERMGDIYRAFQRRDGSGSAPIRVSAVNFAMGWKHESETPPNIWIGTSVEDQKRADERIPALLRIPAKVRFLSCEPLLGPLGEIGEWEEPDQGGSYYIDGIHWVICGGESGPNARPMHPDWARSLRDQCKAAGVPFFFKQWGEYLPGEAIINPDPDNYENFFRSASDGKSMFSVPGRKYEALNLTRTLNDIHSFKHGDVVAFWKGKKTSGRFLDGQEHNEFPSFSPCTPI
jgi:protein gp37